MTLLNNKKYSAFIFVVLLFSCSFIGLATPDDMNIRSRLALRDGNTLYVGGDGPGNYTFIQEAIDNATDGDTVFVYDDSSPYFETLSVYHSITLIGENMDTTCIEGAQRAISIYADHVTVTGFTITFCGDFWNCAGIYLNSDENLIFHNNITDNLRINGIFLDTASYNIIVGNTINNNEFHGIRLADSHHNIVRGNNLSNNLGYSIYLMDSSDNQVFENTIQRGYWTGMFLEENAQNNTIYHNNFINNPGGNAYDAWNNTWDGGNPMEGNYWDEYTGEDANQDGIGDTPFDIPGNSTKDYYPLMEPYGIEEPQIQITITGGFGISVTVKNIGQNELEHLDWLIHLDGGILLLPRERIKEGVVQILAPQQSIELQSPGLFFGIGRLNVTVTVEETTASSEGLLLFFLYIPFTSE